MKDILMLIDGNAMLNVFYYATLPEELKKENDPEMYRYIPKNNCGLFVNAVDPFFAMIRKMSKEISATHMAVVFDTAVETYRKQACPEYKANRSSRPYPLAQQVYLIKEALEQAGVSVYTHNRYEGDDLAATIVKHSRDRFDHIGIITTDHDYFQLVSDKVSVLLYLPNTNRMEEYKAKFPDYIMGYRYLVVTPAIVQAIEGVPPQLIPDKKGICGDSSDNISGVKGVGESCLWILNACGSVERLYQALETMPEDQVVSAWKAHNVSRPGYLYKKFNTPEAKNAAMFCKRLATMFPDADLKDDHISSLKDIRSDKLNEFLKFAEPKDDVTWPAA